MKDEYIRRNSKVFSADRVAEKQSVERNCVLEQLKKENYSKIFPVLEQVKFYLENKLVQDDIVHRNKFVVKDTKLKQLKVKSCQFKFNGFYCYYNRYTHKLVISMRKNDFSWVKQFFFVCLFSIFMYYIGLGIITVCCVPFLLLFDRQKNDNFLDYSDY